MYFPSNVNSCFSVINVSSTLLCLHTSVHYFNAFTSVHFNAFFFRQFTSMHFNTFFFRHLQACISMHFSSGNLRVCISIYFSSGIYKHAFQCIFLQAFTSMHFNAIILMFKWQREKTLLDIIINYFLLSTFSFMNPRKIIFLSIKLLAYLFTYL